MHNRSRTLYLPFNQRTGEANCPVAVEKQNRKSRGERNLCSPKLKQRVWKELNLEVRILEFTLFPTWWANLSEDRFHLCNDRTVLDTSERLPVIWHESTALRDFLFMSVDACWLVKSFELGSQGTNSLSLQFFYVNDSFIQCA